MIFARVLGAALFEEVIGGKRENDYTVREVNFA